MHSMSRTIPSRARPCGRGFSLVELVAVLTIAAIVAAVTVPAMSSTGAVRRSAAAWQVARDLRVAREIGITTGRNAWVTFDATAESYTIRIEPFGNPGRAQAVGWIDPATGREFRQRFGDAEWAGVAIVSASFGGGSVVGFDRLGGPLVHTGAAMLTTGQVVLEGGGTVSIEPGTGRVEVGP